MLNILFVILIIYRTIALITITRVWPLSAKWFGPFLSRACTSFCFQPYNTDNDVFIYLEVDRMLHSNVDVQLFDAYHSLLKTSAKPDIGPESIYEDHLAAGVYFIRIYSPDDGIGQYRLTPTIGTLTSPIYRR